MNTRGRTIEQILGIVALGLLLIGCFLVLRPFLSSTLWAIILVFTTWPVYGRLEKLLRGRRTLAATCMTLLVALVLLAPFVLIGLSLVDDVRGFADASRRFIQTGLPGPPAWVSRLPLVGPTVSTYWESLTVDRLKLKAAINPLIEPATTWLLIGGAALVRGLGQLALSVLIAFFFFRDGPAAANRLTLALERLAGDEARHLLDLAGRTVRGVVYGILGTALGQAIIAGVGFLIAGVPRGALLALLTFFLSIVPFGPPLVWIPVTVWLFYHGQIGWGIFMVIWGLLISSVDNVIKPVLIGYGSNIPFILILFGVLGGAATFGFIGVFLGPTLLAVAFRLLEQWNINRRPSTAVAPLNERSSA